MCCDGSACSLNKCPESISWRLHAATCRPRVFMLLRRISRTIADLLAEAGQVGSNLDMLLRVLIDSAYSTPV